MRRLADGSLETEIIGVSRADELGEMARALGIFKQNALQKAVIEQRSEDQRVQAEEERRHNDLQRSQVEQQIAFAVDALAKGMERLSKGDISQTIDTPLYGRLEQLRLDFNDSVARLNSTMVQIHANTYSIQLNLRDLSDSADQLAKRTEQQAAALEETAAAVEEVTTAVKSASQKSAGGQQRRNRSRGFCRRPPRGRWKKPCPPWRVSRMRRGRSRRSSTSLTRSHSRPISSP
ncbi:methyl-accepting chemotaxis protein (plasmid) [Rhizobium leguminosarum]|nr:methyl-accepting chemotaxis protein [Rhizobium leguminosarum]